MAADEIAVVPVFLFEAGHLKRDLPAALAKAGRPGLTFRVGGPLGLDPALVRIAASQVRPEETVLLVGRGASDPFARAGLFEVGRLLAAETGCAGVVPAFCDVAAPGLEEGLAACLAGGAVQVAVLPYLLFQGVLTERIATRVSAWQTQGLPVRLAGGAGLGSCPGMAEFLKMRVGRMG
jgi:sirohydrochlorin cobaltochelatase